ncbi:unnamed protein product [Sympodiomycopsis kandeliae]
MSDQTNASSSGPSSLSTDTHSLYTHIALPLIFGSNIGPTGERDINLACRRCIKPWDKRHDMGEWTESLSSREAQSDANENADIGGDGEVKMIINIPFTAPVRISSILINQGAGENAPSRLQAYVNRPHGLDLEEVNTTTSSTGAPSTGYPQADFNLRPQDTTPNTLEERIQEYPLGRFSPRFSTVNSLSIVLTSSSASYLKVYYLSVRGTPPKEVSNANNMTRVFAEDAASNPMGRVKENAGGQTSTMAAGMRGAAADGSGGQAR